MSKYTSFERYLIESYWDKKTTRGEKLVINKQLQELYEIQQEEPHQNNPWIDLGGEG